MTFKGRGRRRLLGAGLGSLAGSALASLAGCAKPREKENPWKSALELDASRQPVSGSGEELVGAIRRGADLRIMTEFKNNEHIDTGSDSAELIEEVAEFAGTYLIEDRWVAGIMTLRQPISLPDGFGSRPSMSFFLYNQDGRQAIARPYLDGGEVTAEPGPSDVADHSSMPKYHQLDGWDQGTNAPSSNFIYDFDLFNYLVRDDWEEVLAHNRRGEGALGLSRGSWAGRWRTERRSRSPSGASAPTWPAGTRRASTTRSSSRPGPTTTIRSSACSSPEAIPWSGSSRECRCSTRAGGGTSDG